MDPATTFSGSVAAQLGATLAEFELALKSCGPAAGSSDPFAVAALLDVLYGFDGDREAQHTRAIRDRVLVFNELHETDSDALRARLILLGYTVSTDMIETLLDSDAESFVEHLRGLGSESILAAGVDTYLCVAFGRDAPQLDLGPVGDSF